MFAQHIRLTVRGRFDASLNGGANFEEWSWRVNMSDPAASEDPVDDQNQLDDIVADVTAFHARPESRIGSTAVLREIKVARIGPLGTYLAEPRVAFVNVQGGGQALRYPSQVSLAVSLMTETRGAGGRGRFYLPAPSGALLSNTGRMAVADRDAVAGSVKTLLDNLNDQPGLEGNAPRVVVASSKGMNSTVTAVRVGDVFDTIRRRRNGLGEVYTAALAVV